MRDSTHAEYRLNLPGNPGAALHKLREYFNEVPRTQEVLLWHKRHEPDPAHTWLRELIVQLAKES